MRALLISALFAAVLSTARGQQQEQKLLDRLLKPNMSLQNTSYDKQFNTVDSTVDRKARTKTFYVADRRAEKRFVTGNFATTSFRTRESRYQRQTANTKPRNGEAHLNAEYQTTSYPGVRAAADSKKSVGSSEFTDAKRSFLVRGKSQKSLSAQDRPLTIDQVRELLNKNK